MRRSGHHGVGDIRAAAMPEAALHAARVALRHDFTPLTDMRASHDYRMAAAQNLLTKFYLETSNPALATRLVGAPELAHV